LRTTYRFIALLATVAIAVGASTAFAHDGDDHGGDILRSGLVGSTPLTATPPGPTLFGVPPAGAPWVIGDSEARVRSDRVRVRGEGLVLTSNGTTGTVDQVVAAVFCNDATTPAFTSAAVPLDREGDFSVDEDLDSSLPSPCLAPAVLVRIFRAPAPGLPRVAGAYIAANGG
jgi:hypothetical protein